MYDLLGYLLELTCRTTPSVLPSYTIPRPPILFPSGMQPVPADEGPGQVLPGVPRAQLVLPDPAGPRVRAQARLLPQGHEARWVGHKSL